MGQHRDEERLRGVSRGPVIAAVSVLVVILAIVGWFQLRDRISDQGVAAAQTCVEGEVVLDIAADPDVAATVRAVADRYNATAPVVRDHCVQVSVADAPSDAVVTGLSQPDLSEWTGPVSAPALWVPQSSMAITRLTHPEVVSGVSKSVAYSPVVLAVPDALRDGLTRARIGWQDLPRLQGDPKSLPELGLPGWGGLKLALAPAWESSALTGDSVAAAVAGAGTGPVTAEQAQSPSVTSALTTLARGSRVLGDLPPTAADGLTALAAQTDLAGGQFHAVPVTQQQLDALDATDVSGYAPAGAAPVADHPAVVVAAPWVDETRSRAAAQFAEYLRAPEQYDIVTGAGFTTTAPGGTLVPSDPATVAAMLAPITATASTRSTTVLLDVSASMTQTDGGATKLANVTGALAEQIDAAPDDSEVGLWLYSRGLDGNRPYRVAVATGPLSENRDDLESALGSVRAGTATSTYTSVITAYDTAVSEYSDGRTNSVLLVTDGPNDDTSITSAQFLRAVSEASDPGRPVQIDVIAVGENSDAATLQKLADQTGGTMRTVPDSSGPDFAQALQSTLG